MTTPTPQPQSSEVLAIGTPIVDQVVKVSEEFLQSLSGPLGGSQAVDYSTLCAILEKSGQIPILTPGGSAANTIKGLAGLGRQCAFFGKIGKDEIGIKFKESLEIYNIEPRLLLGNAPTAQVACLVAPDSDRTFRSYLGAGKEMKAEDLKPELFSNIKLVHIEGYLLDRGTIVPRAMELAKYAGAKISFDVSSFEIVQGYKKLIVELLTNYVDVVFANEEEARALTGADPHDSSSLLKDICDVAIVKMGSKGCWVASGQEKDFQIAYNVPAIDTTGAGDLFASGFLHGYLSQRPLRECALFGTAVAAEVVQIIGAEIPLQTLDTVNASFG